MENLKNEVYQRGKLPYMHKANGCRRANTPKPHKDMPSMQLQAEDKIECVPA